MTRLFAELPAGLASVSLRLHGGPNCRPPISRMGNKAGYAEVILAALGATVAISEAEVVIPEWCAVEITAGRKGQKRTFSKQQAEWVTMNREPAHRVATQARLFA